MELYNTQRKCKNLIKSGRFKGYCKIQDYSSLTWRPCWLKCKNYNSAAAIPVKDANCHKSSSAITSQKLAAGFEKETKNGY